MNRLNGKLTESDRAEIEGAFRLFQSKVLHGPISALTEEPAEEASGHTLLDALRKLFRLQD
jgi:glutamyl-tRNA reductase